MINERHTSGPWVTARIHAGEGYVHSVRQNIAGQPTIAMVWDDNDNPMMASPDANLIAAAPDLLAALERLEAQISQTSAYDFACKGDDPELLADVGFARAAIAKAKGT